MTRSFFAHRQRFFWRIAPLLLLLLTGCSTLPDGPRWGGTATLRPGWARVETAAVRAALSPGTWAPLAGAAVFGSTGLDRNLSRWASRNTPLFGSQNGAEHASDYLAGATFVAWVATVVATPSGERPGEWLRNKAAGSAVDVTAIAAASGTTQLLKHETDRVRPNGHSTNSFPSGHATAAAVFATLASRNLNDLPISPLARSIDRAGLLTLTAATAWSRVEADRHYPSDVLTGMAIGHFFGAFFDDAFLGPRSPVRLDTSVAPGGRAISFNLLWRY